MGIFSDISNFILAGALVINILLAFLVYRSNRKSATSIIFVILCLATSAWLLLINVSSSPSSPNLTLWYTRLTVFVAVPQSVSFFLLAHTLPNEAILLDRRR